MLNQPKTLTDKLKALYCFNAVERYEALAKHAARHNLSYEKFLEQLVDEELCAKDKRSIERRVREAKFPAITTLDQYDFSHPKKVDKKLVLELFDLKFIEKKEWVVFLGSSGLGKTHLAKALGYAACGQGYRALFTKTAQVVSALQAAQSDNSQAKSLHGFTKPDLLILDEAGFLPLDQGQANLLFQVISDRYEYGRGATIITTNLAFKDWGRIFHDSVLAQAAVDRIIHRCQVVKIEGDSYRSKGKQTD
ncbi:ATP-binding protein [Candidatus Peregrinibacteria bacterium]|nr:ATP-binding protein [Candidatus Peregrinibacteria bacterium]